MILNLGAFYFNILKSGVFLNLAVVLSVQFVNQSNHLYNIWKVISNEMYPLLRHSNQFIVSQKNVLCLIQIIAKISM